MPVLAFWSAHPKTLIADMAGFVVLATSVFPYARFQVCRDDDRLYRVRN